MRYIFNNFCAALMLLYTSTASAQSAITIEASQVASGFRFYKSDGSRDNKYGFVNSGAYSVGVRHTAGGFLFRINAGMRRGGATLTEGNNSYAWDMRYLDFKLGIGHMLRLGKFRPYGMVSGYYAPLLQASQNINAMDYDIKRNGSVSASDYGVTLTAGASFEASDYVGLYAECNYLRGMCNLEKSSTQKLYNGATYFSLGISAKIVKSAPKWLQDK